MIHPEMILGNTDLDGLDPGTVKVFRAFRAAALAHRQLLDRALAARGGNPTEAMCLRMLEAGPGMSQKDLAELLHFSRPRITGVLQDLERQGHIVRRPDTADQRLTRVYLTEQGLERTRELQAVFTSVLQHTIGSLTDEERSQAEETLRHITTSSSDLLRELQEGHDIASLPGGGR